jgi:N-carbamoyl-L-amino-acid hydrolase
MEPLTLDDLNASDDDAFARRLADVYDGAPWVAAEAASQRPFPSVAALRRALVQAVRAAPRVQQLALLHEHARSAQRARPATALSSAPTTVEAARLTQLGEDYAARFGWPFALAACGPRGTGLSSQQCITTLERRLTGHADFEFAECLRQLHRVAEDRLNAAFGLTPTLGNLVWDWAETLATHSDPGFKEEGQLTVTYLTDAHRACAGLLQEWMKDTGFDAVTIDAVGNVVGVYHGADPRAPRLLTGSHYDTVRNAGRYDGRLGIFTPMACVRELARAGRRLPFGVEVVGFAEEEGQRYKATFLGSGALTGDFEPAWIDQVDADGIRMSEAMLGAGLPANLSAISALRRDPARYLGFVEVHIEQGPVLNELDLPLGVVTSINGGVRYVGEVLGVASHAGTTPMDRRRDAAAAVAELILYVERRAAAVLDAVGTVGLLQVPAGSINVVPGRCRFSLDLRATTNEVRDALAADVTAEIERICTVRGLSYSLERTMIAAAAPSAPAWQQRWERAVQALGLPVFRMPSGAGHDAMKLHEVMPQAMLFVRGENAGISHNPLESTTSDDAELAVRAFQGLLDDIASELT